VRGFLKSGFADEQLRVGALLQDIFQQALELDWQSQKLKRSPSPMPPIAISLANLPLIERLLPKQVDEELESALDLDVNQSDPNLFDDEFWRAYHALNRAELFQKTIDHLQANAEQLSLGLLAEALPPTHDLETLAFWLAMARQAGIPLGEHTESIELSNDEQERTRFHVPFVKVDYPSVKDLKVESLE
jgi:hypothetical protein